MMEPVALAGAGDDGVIDIAERRDIAEQWLSDGLKVEPLVRLSDAEARIAELEELAKVFEAEANQMREVSIKNRHRAEAAEALLKEAREALEPFLRQLEALHESWPDDWRLDVLNSERWHLKVGDFRAARAIHHKIGVKDE